MANNPFLDPILRGNYATAIELRKLVVHLFNNSMSPDMASLMLRDKEHRALALAMLNHYAEYGEECQVFMEVAREISIEIHGVEDDEPGE
jgi:hypothetical protein